MPKSTTIFRQLILNIILPVVIALLILAVLNYRNTKKLLVDSNTTKNAIITQQIKHVMEFQDVALGLLESRINENMGILSEQIINKVEKANASGENIESINLSDYQKELGMDAVFEDIYIINTNGIVVNSTFKDDIGLNLFSFGKEHQELLENVFKSGKFISETFAIESKTRRLKKYSYQPTSDKEFIVELGFYSNKADDITEFISNTLSNISRQQTSVLAVDLFIGEDIHFALNKDIILEGEHLDVLNKVFDTKEQQTLTEKIDGKTIYYEYIFMGRQKTRLYKSSVIRITNDRTEEVIYLRNELIKVLLVFSLTIFLVILLIYRKTRVITEPIRKLVTHVNRITNGHLDERVLIGGSKEISNLSEHFNVMISTIQEYYNELEEKVRQRTIEISRQKEKIEEQNKHITDSISYARNIQNAVLPPYDLISKRLNDFFIIFKPRDIVSGDFYWISQRGESIIVAAVDCTGHGVPGAFMSMLGIALLNEIVSRQTELNSEHILQELRSEVINSLRQTGKEGEAKDGMDISLCIIDYKSYEMQFSGAHNHLYFIRDNELIEYKADRIPIGFNVFTNEKSFTRHLIQLKKGDSFYISSDGYTDQFGGPKNKKFGTKQFKELIVEIQSKGMREQKLVFEETLENWKGHGDQIDDILVIGIKI